MSKAKKEAIEKIVCALEEYPDVGDSYEDAEPASYYDAGLDGLLKSLLQHAEDLGWVQLEKFIQQLIPVSFTGVNVLQAVRNYVVPETKGMLEHVDVELALEKEVFWGLIHPRIKSISKPRFDSGFFADSVEAAFKEINSVVKRLVKDINGRELDGSNLMNTAFSLSAPILILDDIETESGKNIQQGYMQIFSGSMTGIRNPKAHGNIDLDRVRTIHLLMLASLLMSKVDERHERA